MFTPGTDIYEVREQLHEVAKAVGALGKLLMDPTPGDTSLHPEVRGVMVGLADAMAGAVDHFSEDLHSAGLDQSVFDTEVKE